MDFSFTEEQTLLRDTRRELSWPTHYDFDKRRAAVASPRPAGGRRSGRRSPRISASWARRSPKTWAAWAAAPTETMVVMEEFGKALVVEPYLGTVVIGGGFLKHAGHAGGGRADRRDHRRRGDHRLRLGRAAGPLQLRRPRRPQRARTARAMC